MTLCQERLSGWRFLLFNAILGLGHVVVLFNVASYVALIPHAAGDLGGVRPSFGTWAQTDFMIGLALAFPLGRWLSARVGDCRLLVAAFVVYAGASWLCAVSPSLSLFLPSRILLGLVGGLTVPLVQSMLLHEYPDRLKPVGLAVWGLFTLLPFTVGFPLGGWVADELGWRRLFIWNIPAALLVAGAVGALLYGRGIERREARLDFVGSLLLGAVLLGLQTILNMGNDFDWLDAPLLQGLLAAVLVALPCLLIWEWGEPDPALDIRLFRHRNFAVGVLCLTAGFFCVQGLLSLFVVQLQVLLGYSASLAGMVFFSMLLPAAPAMALMHALCARIDARLLVSLNCLGFAYTYYWIGLFDDPFSYDQIVWPMLLQGVFLGAFFTPLAVLTLHGLAGERARRASETANLLRLAAGALGIAFQGVVLFRRTPFHQLHLADHFGGRTFSSFDGLQRLTASLQEQGLSAEAAQAKLAGLIRQEAGILGLNDAFLLASALFLALAAIVWTALPTRPAWHPSREEEVRQLRNEELLEQP